MLYNYGLIIGRFQTVHRGHEFLIRRGLKLCNKVIVYVGSAQESETKTNPYDFQTRKEMLIEIFNKEYKQGRLLIAPLNDIDVGNNDAWGRYVLDRCVYDFSVLPDLYITGCEKERSSWFTNEIAPHMDELRLTRHNIEICASDCRTALLEGKYDEWKLMVPEKLYKLYNNLKEKLEKANGR